MTCKALILIVDPEGEETLLHRVYDGHLAMTGADLYVEAAAANGENAPVAQILDVLTNLVYPNERDERLARVFAPVEQGVDFALSGHDWDHFYVIEQTKGERDLHVGHYEKNYDDFPECYADENRQRLDYDKVSTQIRWHSLEGFRGCVNADIERANQRITEARATGDFLGRGPLIELLGAIEPYGDEIDEKIELENGLFNMPYLCGKKQIFALREPANDRYRFFIVDRTIPTPRVVSEKGLHAGWLVDSAGAKHPDFESLPFYTATSSLREWNVSELDLRIDGAQINAIDIDFEMPVRPVEEKTDELQLSM